MDKIFEKIVNVNTHILDVLYLIYGVILLSVLNYKFSFPFNNYPNHEHINSILFTILIISISYVSGRITGEIGNFWIYFIDILFKKNKINHIKKSFNQFIKLINEEDFEIPNSNKISDFKIDSFLEEKKLFYNTLVRNIISSVFLKGLIGLLILFLIIYFNITLLIIIFVALIILTFIYYENQLEILSFKSEIASEIIKK